MKGFVKDLQKLRIVVSFYRNQVYFWWCGRTDEEKLGFGFSKRCETIANSIDPTQRELVSILMDESLPLQKRLMAIVSRLEVLLEELEETATEEELENYKLLLESIRFDLTEMQSLLGDFVAEAND